jgi:hypothetical protein
MHKKIIFKNLIFPQMLKKFSASCGFWQSSIHYDADVCILFPDFMLRVVHLKRWFFRLR